MAETIQLPSPSKQSESMEDLLETTHYDAEPEPEGDELPPDPDGDIEDDSEDESGSKESGNSGSAALLSVDSQGVSSVVLKHLGARDRRKGSHNQGSHGNRFNVEGKQTKTGKTRDGRTHIKDGWYDAPPEKRTDQVSIYMSAEKGLFKEGVKREFTPDWVYENLGYDPDAYYLIGTFHPATKDRGAMVRATGVEVPSDEVLDKVKELFPEAERISWMAGDRDLRDIETQPIDQKVLEEELLADTVWAKRALAGGVLPPKNMQGGRKGSSKEVQESLDYLEELYAGWHDSLTDDEKDAVKRYHSGGTSMTTASDMNAALRGDDLTPDKRDGFDDPDLQSAMQKAPVLDRPITVARAAHWDRYPREGDRFIDHGYSSTSPDPKVAALARKMHGYPQFAVIELPAGTRGFFMPNYNGIPDYEFLIDRGGEYELLEANDDRLRFRLTGFHRSGSFKQAAPGKKAALKSEKKSDGDSFIKRLGDWDDDALELIEYPEMEPPKAATKHLGPRDKRKGSHNQGSHGNKFDAKGNLLKQGSSRQAADPSTWTTAKEAEKGMDEKYPEIGFDLDGWDDDIAVSRMQKMDELLQKYPVLQRQIKAVETVNMWHKGFPGAAALYSYEDQKISFSHDDVRNKSRVEQRYADAAEVWYNWFPIGSGDVNTPMVHEMGHALDQSLGGSHSLEIFSRSRGPHDPDFDTEQDKWKIKQRGRAQLSKYAATNETEGFAEGFLALENGSTSQSVYLKAFRKRLDALRAEGRLS